MAKTNLTKILLYAVIGMLVLSIANASVSKLIFSDVDVKVGGRTSDNLVDGDEIDEEADPGDIVEFRIKVMNNFTSSENLKLKDITVKVTIDGIDDGADLEEESNQFDLSAESDKRVILKFEVPFEVEEEIFNALIHAEGEDKNGTNHESEMRLRLEVNKETHSLKITKAILIPAEVSCNRKSIKLSAAVVNIGSDDESDITISAQNAAIGLDLKDEVKELTAEPGDPDSRFSKTYNFNIPDALEAASYPITLSALYDNGRKKAEETAVLTVNDCQAKKIDIRQAKSSEGNEEVEIITLAGKSNISAKPSEPTIIEGAFVTQEGNNKGNWLMAGIITVEMIAVAAGIALIAYLFRKGKKS